VSRAEVEQVLLGEPAVMIDPYPGEPHMWVMEKTADERYVFLVFMSHEINGQTKLRPISARYMHQKEIDHYEQRQI